MKITDYDFCSGNSALELRENVVKKLAEGWQPYGDPLEGKYGWSQCMVQYNSSFFTSSTGPR